MYSDFEPKMLDEVVPQLVVVRSHSNERVSVVPRNRKSVFSMNIFLFSFCFFLQNLFFFLTLPFSIVGIKQVSCWDCVADSDVVLLACRISHKTGQM